MLVYRPGDGRRIALRRRLGHRADEDRALDAGAQLGRRLQGEALVSTGHHRRAGDLALLRDRAAAAHDDVEAPCQFSAAALALLVPRRGERDHAAPRRQAGQLEQFEAAVRQQRHRQPPAQRAAAALGQQDAMAVVGRPLREYRGRVRPHPAGGVAEHVDAKRVGSHGECDSKCSLRLKCPAAAPAPKSPVAQSVEQAAVNR